MKKKIVLAIALALCLALSACGSKSPSLEEVESAIRDGSVTIEDALDKGWVTQEWADNYLEENTVPAADKIAYNMVEEFETETLAGEPFTNKDLPDTAFLAFLDPEDAGAADFCKALAEGADGVRSAGADIVLCVKGSMDAQMLQDLPFPVIAYNDSMKAALAQNDEMASEIPCVGVWYVNGSLISAWSSQIEGADLADSAASFVEMGADSEGSSESGSGDSMTAMTIG